MPSHHTLEEVVDFLNRRRLRATYGAVADFTGSNATFLMSPIERAPRYSWIVNQKTMLPTGYSDAECHPELRRSTFVIRTGDELRDWMARPEPKPRAD